jgi:hypothetical protein
MSSLQTLIEGIVTGLVEARAAADARAAELAEAYRDHPTLRSLSVPTLNLTKVSVDLRVAFDETPIESATGPSPAQQQAVDDTSETIRRRIMNMGSVSASVPHLQTRGALALQARDAVARSAAANLDAPAEERRAAMDKEVQQVLSRGGVKLSAADHRLLTEELAGADRQVATAPAARPRIPGVIVAGKALAEQDAASLTTIRFDVELRENTWADVDAGDGTTGSVLSRS